MYFNNLNAYLIVASSSSTCLLGLSSNLWGVFCAQ
jgi:hypothetical protein